MGVMTCVQAMGFPQASRRSTLNTVLRPATSPTSGCCVTTLLATWGGPASHSTSNVRVAPCRLTCGVRRFYKEGVGAIQPRHRNQTGNRGADRPYGDLELGPSLEFVDAAERVGACLTLDPGSGCIPNPVTLAPRCVSR
eukprot:1194633-Prorocentrum_minimum.AAC.7